MSTPQLQVRRATIDDLPKLAPLWREENLDVNDLEKRFKEFQIVEGPSGEVVGAVGLQVAGQEGRLHSEVFARPEQADLAREKLWERAQILVNNHGLLRSALADKVYRLAQAIVVELIVWKIKTLSSGGQSIRIQSVVWTVSIRRPARKQDKDDDEGCGNDSINLF